MSLRNFVDNIKAPWQILLENRYQQKVQEQVRAKQAQVASVQLMKSLKPLLLIGAAFVVVMLVKKKGKLL